MSGTNPPPPPPPPPISHPGPGAAMAHPPAPPLPTPGTALYLPVGALDGASEAQRKAVRRAELRFQAKVSRAASDAYDEIDSILYSDFKDGR